MDSCMHSPIYSYARAETISCNDIVHRSVVGVSSTILPVVHTVVK